MEKKVSKYNWNMVFILSAVPLIGVFGTLIYTYYQGVVWQEVVMMFVFWFLSGIGITMGYHRLFSHRAFKTNAFIEWVLMLMGSMALENTILKWASDHRRHHTKAETEEDPYSITKGFWHAHIGWILKNTPDAMEKIRGVKDLEAKSAIRFQSKYYFHLGIVLGFFLPVAIGFLYGRPGGAILWAGFLRLAIVHHATFFINSLCHYVGSRTYDRESTARDSWFVSLFTFGEGYHNYHHKFQWDFRNGVKWFAYDPSKWFIIILSWFGVTWELRKVKEQIIWDNKLESLKVLLNQKLENSAEQCKLYYEQKIEQLHSQKESLMKSWKEMERNYTNLEKDFIENKMHIKALKQERKVFLNNAKELRRNFNIIISNVKRNRLHPQLAH